MADDFGPALRKLVEAAAGLPDVVEGTSYGTPSLKLGKKSFCRLKDATTVVLFCSLEEKEMLLEAAPEIYFETDHYKGWPAILARLDRISQDELAHRLEQAWRRIAPKRAIAKLDRARQT